MCHMLIEESSNKHALRSRLCVELYITMYCAMQPIQVVRYSILPSVYDSALHVGDTENAMNIGFHLCTISFFTGVDLKSLLKRYTNLMKAAVS